MIKYRRFPRRGGMAYFASIVSGNVVRRLSTRIHAVAVNVAARALFRRTFKHAVGMAGFTPGRGMLTS